MCVGPFFGFRFLLLELRENGFNFLVTRASGFVFLPPFFCLPTFCDFVLAMPG